MKKISLLLLGLLALFSCEQEGLETNFDKKNIVDQSQQANTRLIPTNDPIWQFANIPVNIRNVGNTTNPYLSCKEKNANVTLTSIDDGSLRQRWYIRGGVLKLAGGNVNCTSSNWVFVAPKSTTGETEPILGVWTPPVEFPTAPISTIFEPLNNGCYKICRTPSFAGSSEPLVYLQSTSKTGNTLTFKREHSTNLAQWEVIPIGEFRILGITYELNTDDHFEATPVVVRTQAVENAQDVTVPRKVLVETVISNESSFSETKGINVNITNGSSIKLAIPGFGEGGFSNSVSVSSNWSYTTSDKETQTFKISEELTLQVPAHSTQYVKLVAIKYNAAVTYVMRLELLGSSEIIYLRGKWTGVVVNDTYIKVYNEQGVMVDSKEANYGY